MSSRYDPDYDDDKAEEEGRRLGDRIGLIILIVGTILVAIYIFGGGIQLPHS